MTEKSGSCQVITFDPIESLDNYTQEQLEEFFDVVSVDYTDDGFEIYKGYKNTSFKEEELQDFISERNLTLPPHKTELLESDNWLKDYVIRFAPVEVEEFLIYGVHEKETPKTDKLAIRIYAATAFGSEHQTTKSCLKAISELNKMNAPHAKILDVGTGSGILSLAAAKLWGQSTHITAVDIDEEAVIVTRGNAADNDLEDFITAAVSNGYQSELVKQNAPYDIIFANILARPLIEMAPDLAKSLKSGGYCILSGFVGDQEDWVIKAHEEQGLSLVKIYELDNWRAALMEKK